MLAEHPLPARLISTLERLPPCTYKYLSEQIAEMGKELGRQLGEDDLEQRLMKAPGVCPVTAIMLSAELGDGKQYRCGRDFAASRGLVPRQYSTGGRTTLLGIGKRGDKTLRRLLVQCARVYLQRLDKQKGRLADWVRSMLVRRHSNVVACALSNNLARTVWALAPKHTGFNGKATTS